MPNTKTKSRYQLVQINRRDCSDCGHSGFLPMSSIVKEFPVKASQAPRTCRLFEDKNNIYHYPLATDIRAEGAPCGPFGIFFEVYPIREG